MKEDGYFKYVDYEDGVWIVGGYVDPPGYYDASGDVWVHDESMEVTWTIPNSLAGKKVIGMGDLNGCYERFENAWEASKIVMPETIKYISDGTFEDYGVKEINLPNGLEKISSNMFAGCESLVEINIPSNVKYIGSYTFQNCKQLKDIKLPQNLVEIGSHAFDGCMSIKNVNIPKTVEEIGNYAFSDCRLLESLVVDSDNKNYFSVDGMLCERRTDYIESEETYYDADDDEYYHEMLEVPITYVLQYPLGKKGKLSIAKDMLFEGAALMNAIGVEEYVVDDENRYYASEDGTLLNKEKTDLKYVPCSKTGEFTVPDTVTIINFSAFSNSSLSKINIPDSVVGIGDYAFYQCSNLESINIGKGLNGLYGLDTCENLKEIKISSDNNNYVAVNNVIYDKKIERLLLCPRGYTGKLTIPDSVKDCSFRAFVSKDLDDKYYRCDGITELYLGEQFEDAVSYDDEDGYEVEMFFPKSLEKITVSDNNINYSSVDGILYSKDKTKTIMIPSMKKEIKILDGVVDMLCGCSNYNYYNSITIPQSVKTISDTFYAEVMYGYTGSYAELYAKEYNIKFESIGVATGDDVDQKTTGENNITQPTAGDTSKQQTQKVDDSKLINTHTNTTFDTNMPTSVETVRGIKGLLVKNKKVKRFQQYGNSRRVLTNIKSNMHSTRSLQRKRRQRQLPDIMNQLLLLS